MQNNRTKKNILIAIGVLFVFLVSAGIAVFVMVLVKNNNQQEPSTSLSNGTALVVIDALNEYADTKQPLSTLTVSEPEHEAAANLTVADQSVYYQIQGNHSLTLNSEAPFDAAAYKAATQALETFFTQQGLEKVVYPTNAAGIALFANDKTACSTNGGELGKSIAVTCEDKGLVGKSIKTAQDLMSTASFTVSLNSLVTVKQASNEAKSHTVYLINIISDKSKILGSLLFTQKSSDKPAFIVDLASGEGDTKGGKMHQSEASTTVQNDPDFGPLLSTVLGTKDTVKR